MNTTDITRVVVIYDDGTDPRLHESEAMHFERVGIEVTLDIQDEGRTLKVFVKDRDDAAQIRAEYVNSLRQALRTAASKVTHHHYCARMAKAGEEVCYHPHEPHICSCGFQWGG
jgi:hypothetical protein